MLKHFYCLMGLTAILSCTNPVANKDSNIESDISTNSGESDLPQDTSVLVFDSSSYDPPLPRKENVHLPKELTETYPRLINSLFAHGSSMEEIENILGRPEYIEKKTEQVTNTGRRNGLEVWYYGKLEITFKNGYVSNLFNYQGNEHCLYNYGMDTGDLLVSNNY
jgi:hypothetical protein